MPHPNIDPTVHKRYAQASTIRAVIHRLNPSTKHRKSITDYVETHGIRFHRMRTIDDDVVLGASDTKAPEIITHHINDGVRGARSHLDNWDFVIENLGSGNTAYRHTTQWVNNLNDRINPAMYCAKLEIDPSGVYEQEYLKLRAEFLNRCKTIHEAHQSLGSRRSTAKRQEEKSRYRDALERFVSDLEEWQTRALSDLAPSTSSGLELNPRY